MFEVLMFIFENYMDNSIALKADTQTLMVELEHVGFTRNEIDRALDWLEGLSRYQTVVEITSPSLSSAAMRHYLPEEMTHLGVEGVGFILYLEQSNILDPTTREVVIDRIMALDSQDVDLGRVKWVVLMVLFSQINKKSALSMLQDIILSEDFGVAH